MSKPHLIQFTSVYLYIFMPLHVMLFFSVIIFCFCFCFVYWSFLAEEYHNQSGGNSTQNKVSEMELSFPPKISDNAKDYILCIIKVENYRLLLKIIVLKLYSIFLEQVLLGLLVSRSLWHQWIQQAISGTTLAWTAVLILESQVIILNGNHW